MALTPMAQNVIHEAIKTAAGILADLKPVLDRLNVIYDAQGGLKATITDQDLPGDATLSGLTKAQLDDGMFVLTSTLRTDLANGYTQLVQLAARAS